MSGPQHTSILFGEIEQMAIDNGNKLAIENMRLRAALKVAKDYLDYSLGSPGYDGPNPYPIIEAALKD